MDHFLLILSSGGVTLLIVALFLGIGNLAAAYLPAQQQQLLRGALFILTGLAVLTFPLQVEGHIRLDQRAAILALAALFGGWRILLATGAAMLVYRAYIGGPSMPPALLGIVCIMAVCGLVTSCWRKRHGAAVSSSLIWIAGVTAGACSALVLLLLIPSATFAWQLFLQESPSLFMVQLVSTCLFGFLLKLQEERQHSMSELERKNIDLHDALLQAVGALSIAMAHRDPGVANHEKRVAALAQALGAELGLGQEQLEGLMLAALVHDIGKLQLPSEIPLRPRKLSEEEFSLVKQHAESGHAILKDVRFPWPLAEIVHQHHEDFDGGGYPRGLAGEHILLEARILRVADSMEVMLSHQPYRRACELDYALASLDEKKGTCYDPQVVEACRRLFRDGRFAFDSLKKAA